MTGGAIVYGYYTAFKKPILNNVTTIPMQIKPSFFKRIFNGEKPYEAIVHFSLVRAYKIYHLFYLPVFWERKFLLHNDQLDILYSINEDLELELEKCKDKNEEYLHAVNKFFKKKK